MNAKMILINVLMVVGLLHCIHGIVNFKKVKESYDKVIQAQNQTKTKREAAAVGTVYATQFKKVNSELDIMYQTCKDSGIDMSMGDPCQTNQGPNKWGDVIHSFCYWDKYIKGFRFKTKKEIEGKCGAFICRGTMTTCDNSSPGVDFYNGTHCLSEPCKWDYCNKFFFPIPCE